MNTPKTARKSVLAGVAAMLLAIVGTMLDPHLVNWGWIAIAIALGFAVGIPLSKVPLTAVPQRTALSHAFGGSGRRLWSEPPSSISGSALTGPRRPASQPSSPRSA